jgi:hypothetical protein
MKSPYMDVSKRWECMSDDWWIVEEDLHDSLGWGDHKDPEAVAAFNLWIYLWNEVSGA